VMSSCFRSAQETILIILVTSTKWSKTAASVVLQLSLAFHFDRRLY